jgi:hypothetical protein
MHFELRLWLKFPCHVVVFPSLLVPLQRRQWR